MKTILTLAFLATTMVSHAVSFTWNSNGVKIQFDGDTTLATAGKITATLLYLGTDTTATIEGYSVSNGIEADSVATASTGLASSRGIYTKKYTNGIGSNIGSGSATLAAGDYFTVLLTYEDNNKVTWYNLSSTVYQLPTDAADNTQGLSGSFSHSFSMNAKGTALSAGGGWTAVPEPSTAALALAGLALLLKRRKA